MTPYELFYISFVKNHTFAAVQKDYLVWLIIELALSIYRGFMAVYFIRTFCGSKRGGKFFSAVNIIFSLAYAAILFTEYFFCGMFINEGFLISVLPLALLSTIYAASFCKGSLAKKYYAVFLSNWIILTVTAICNIMMTQLMGRILSIFIFEDFAKGWAVLLFSPILIYYAMFVVLRLFKKIDITERRSIIQWAAVSVVLVISVAVSMRLFANYIDVDNRVNLLLFSDFVVICVALSDLLVFWLMSDIIKKNKAVNELNLLRQTEEFNRQYIENLKSEYETVRKFRHDCKNSFLTISALLENGEIQKAQSQIEESLGAMKETEIFISTDNAVVNAVANAKLSTAKSLGIECKCLVAKDISGIGDTDLCRLLSNMLDNAITACKNDSGSGLGRIELSIRADGPGYFFSVKNTVSHSVLESNPELRSTKENSAEHGYGVRIIREIAEKYDGRSDFYEEDGMFCCSAYLKKR